MAVKEVSFGKQIGVYEVKLRAETRPDPERFRGAVPKRFKVEKVEISITGEVAQGEGGLKLKATGSGLEVILANRPKRDDEERAPDVVGQIETGVKEGKTGFRVKGVLETRKDKEKSVTVVLLDSAEPVERKS